MLHPEIQEYLEREAASGKPPRSSLTVEQTRASAMSKKHLAGEPVPLPRVVDLRVGDKKQTVPIRIYAPSSQTPLPVFIYIHGGRFISGNLDTHDAVCRRIASLSTCMVVGVDYRLAPENPFPAALHDVDTVAQWLASHGNEIDADPGRIAIGGDSAGGNLAAGATFLARDRGSPFFICQALIYPMLDASCSLDSHKTYARGFGPGSEDMKRGYKEYLPEDAYERDMLISPIWCENLAGLPQALVCTAEYDSLRDEGELYASRLKDAGVEVRHIAYEGAIHGIIQRAAIWELGRRLIVDVAHYLKRTLH
jgi:acetyl esterase